MFHPFPQQFPLLTVLAERTTATPLEAAAADEAKANDPHLFLRLADRLVFCLLTSNGNTQNMTPARLIPATASAISINNYFLINRPLTASGTLRIALGFLVSVVLRATHIQSSPSFGPSASSNPPLHPSLLLELLRNPNGLRIWSDHEDIPQFGELSSLGIQHHYTSSLWHMMQGLKREANGEGKTCLRPLHIRLMATSDHSRENPINRGTFWANRHVIDLSAIHLSYRYICFHSILVLPILLVPKLPQLTLSSLRPCVRVSLSGLQI
ncbi:uncharacterized protein CLUP02_16485 [Colletotrichum lupini]|uniref:Uncharacterized protein n=1 Tax=Colletotrichum lupini TaxID=145971 RepID=A0A9Q8WP92_9PEZI|nr:uncharacterized protein CLUP02_16485 [Colletotrichum lupini]UQC90953.1 hypothetical protein CLUP02_16485 [Colletotrichum lupini]